MRVHTYDGPAALRVDEVEEPKPGAGEVLIDVKAAGVNFPDVLLSRGKYQFKPPPPFSPGGEAAGVVKAVGPDVKNFVVGDRVATTVIYGAFAERIVVPEMATVKLPDAVSFEVGAATLLTYLTDMHALVDRAALRSGETLLVLGAAGGVGVAAIQIGKMLGARVVAAASSAEKLAFCKENGADEVIDYSKEDLKERAKTFAPNVVFDPVGGAFAEPALRAIAWEGRYLVVGFAAGDIPKIPLNLALLKGCQIVGVFWGQFAMREPERNHAHAARVFDAVAKGTLAPRVWKTLPFARAGEALELMEQRKVLGKIVLVP
ncbi:MAG TPA: NADPH:quinone oxidoreductase family protein [Polyangiaceae bacterium]